MVEGGVGMDRIGNGRRERVEEGMEMEMGRGWGELVTGLVGLAGGSGCGLWVWL